jgi:pimeloyl-ACP methyl ester carboxylesterase
LADRGWSVFAMDWDGVGRSTRGEDFYETGPEPTVSAIRALPRAQGMAVLFGHSMAAAIAAKVVDEAPELVAAAAPARLGTGVAAISETRTH